MRIRAGYLKVVFRIEQHAKWEEIVPQKTDVDAIPVQHADQAEIQTAVIELGKGEPVHDGEANMALVVRQVRCMEQAGVPTNGHRRHPVDGIDDRPIEVGEFSIWKCVGLGSIANGISPEYMK